MAIPAYQDLMLPLLRLAEDGKERSVGEVVNELGRTLGLGEEDTRQLFASGQNVFHSRVGWARVYLKRAGALEYPRPGWLRITERGRHLLAGNPAAVRNRDLMQYPEFREFVKREPRTVATGNGAAASTAPDPTEVEAAESPEEQIESGYRRLRADVELDLLNRAKAASPEFFERLVVRLLVAMGYGGSLAEAGETVGRVGDGGIDGVIREDRLGLGVIAVQAKRWGQGTVGSSRPTRSKRRNWADLVTRDARQCVLFNATRED